VLHNTSYHTRVRLLKALEKKNFVGLHGADSKTEELADLLEPTSRSFWDIFNAASGDTTALTGAALGQYPCYKHVGCFNPKNRMGLEVAGPDPPEDVGTEISFFTGGAGGGVRVTDQNWSEVLAKGRWNMKKPLVAIVHGFTESGETPWVISMKDALLKYAGCNVLIVDWRKGAEFPFYFRAARDTPMPGAQLSLLIQKMITSSKNELSAKSVHVVGFSLGAQVAGFCGRHFYIATKKKLGRITGLDPAGPLFVNSTGCLSRDDADFVDVIHANAGSLEHYHLGVDKSVGHVDFYPNGGLRPAWLSYRFFRELARLQPWQGPGAKYDGEMGYHSLQSKATGDQYLRTNDKSPYCIPLPK
ncbi:hypothetical protein MTO96_037561, partial [Rhipicephalus appendiculatus]